MQGTDIDCREVHRVDPEDGKRLATAGQFGPNYRVTRPFFILDAVKISCFSGSEIPLIFLFRCLLDYCGTCRIQ